MTDKTDYNALAEAEGHEYWETHTIENGRIVKLPPAPPTELERLEVEVATLRAEKDLLHNWIDAVGRTNKCIGGCSWGTDGHFSHHPFCKWLSAARAALTTTEGTDG